MGDQIWVPSSETLATVRDGVVTVRDEMRFVSRPVDRKPAGFASAPVESADDDE